MLLAASNVFMTFAWYAHLKDLSDRPWYVAAFVSWGIACFEYLIQVPAHRIGHTQLSINDHPLGLRAVRRRVHEGTAEARLSLGGFMFARSCLLYVSLLDTAHTVGFKAGVWARLSDSTGIGPFNFAQVLSPVNRHCRWHNHRLGE